MQTIKRPETECQKQVLFIIFISMIGSGKTSNGLTEQENSYSEKNIIRESYTRILQLKFLFLESRQENYNVSHVGHEGDHTGELSPVVHFKLQI
jgi:hypothetical protein